MANTSRRVALRWALAAASAAALGVALLGPRWMSESLAQQQTPPESEAPATDPELYSRVQRLRSQLAMTNRDLAALGVTRAQAEAALESLKAWAQQNESRLAEADARVRQAEAALSEALHRIRMGPRDESSIRRAPALQRDVDLAVQQREQLILEAGHAAAASFDGSQRRAWDMARTSDAPGFYRYAGDVSAADAGLLRKALRERARGVEPRGQAANLLRHPAAERARRNTEAGIAQVSAAEAAALPPPPPEAPGAFPEEPRGWLGLPSQEPGPR